MKRFVLVGALAGVGLLVPTAASAAIKQIYVNSASSAYCIAVDNGPTGVTFTARAPGGGVLETRRAATATPGVNCDGASTPGASAFTTTMDTFQGATITADAGGALVIAFPVPFAAHDSAAGSGVVKVANLPGAAGTLTIGGGAPIAYSGPAYSTPAAVAIGNGQIDASSTVSGIAYRARFGSRQFSIDSSYYGNVAVYGTNPLGSAVSATVTVGGAPQQSGSMTPSVDSGQYEQARMPLQIPPGAVVTVTQPGWFSHSVTLAAMNARADGVDVSIPAVAGVTATASVDLSFQATSGLSPSDPLSCLAFGDASYMLSQCGTAVARYAATFPVFFSANDEAYVALIEPDGDHGNSRVSGSGLIAYLEDGTLGFYGFAPNAPLAATATTPAVPSASRLGSTYNDGSAYFGGEGSGYIPAKLVTGTTITASGPATGGPPRSFLLNLEVQGSGTTVSGTTYPGGHVSVSVNRPIFSSSPLFTTADGAGGFAVDVGALLPRDSIRVLASDPSGTVVSERTLYPGSPQPLIQGLVDQQLVHGTISPTALGGGPSGILWGGDGAAGLAVAPPFAYALDTTLLKDGPHLITAYAAGQDYSLGDYVWVRVDNTAPVVSAGTDQYVGVGYSAVLVTNASDANGLGSVVASFGDGASLTQPAADLGQPIRHVYVKAGTYTVKVTATDAAGNTTTDSAVIHAVGSLSEQVSGKFPTTFKQAKKLKKRKNLAVKFTAHMAGKLRVRVLDTKSKVRASGTVTFAAADKKATFTVKSKKWAKGRYTVVLQFTDATGMPGPVVLQPLRIT